MAQWIKLLLDVALPVLQGVAIPLLAVIIAGCALGLTIWQGREQRIHNRKSVLPVVEITAHSGPSAESDHPGIYVSNVGIGPAWILELGIEHEGRPLENAYQLKDLIMSRCFERNSTGDFPATHWEAWGIPYGKPIQHCMLRVGGRRTVLSLDSKYWSEAFGFAFSTLLPSLRITVKWASVYGEEDQSSVELGLVMDAAARERILKAAREPSSAPPSTPTPT